MAGWGNQTAVWAALCACVLLARVSLVVGSNVVLPPSETEGVPVGLVMIEGAQITPESYIPLLNATQRAASGAGLSLWVGVPQFLGSVPDPVRISADVNTILQQMNKAGLPDGSPLFIAGHSLGGAMVQSYTAQHSSKFKGQILMGSFLLRSEEAKQYPVSTLTIGGELDGLCRVTRMGEAMLHYLLR